MVQVDIFWAYGIGAGFAFASGRQLAALKKENKSPFDSKFYMSTLLFLGTCFAPSGVCLLWAFTSWETMHVFTYDTLPAWLVTIFAITNVTQGILGYWVTYKCFANGKPYLGAIQVFIAYFLMFFILVHGWDGTGYQRFFSFTRADFDAWGASPALGNVFAWLVSPVALTLYAMGVILIPWLLAYAVKWTQEGYDLEKIDESKRLSPITIAAAFLFYIFGFGLGLAIMASLIIHALGWMIGTLVFLAVAYAVFLRRNGLMYKFIEATWSPGQKLS
jgi:hypothetical protein